MSPILLDRLISFALDLWSRFASKPAEPTASQRDIAIGVASGEAARREGKIAADIARRQAEESFIETMESAAKKSLERDEIIDTYKRHMGAIEKTWATPGPVDLTSAVKNTWQCGYCHPLGGCNDGHLNKGDCQMLKLSLEKTSLQRQLEDTWPGERK